MRHRLKLSSFFRLHSIGNNIIARVLFFVLLLLAFGLNSCSSKKFLQAGEYLIKKNEIKVEGNHLASAEKARLKELAYTRIPLVPNSNYIFFIPKERANLKYRFADDTSKSAAWMMALDSELPAFADSSRIEAISKNLRNTLQSQGYFDAQVSYGIEYNNKTAIVNYTLVPKIVYRLDSFQTISRDTALIEVIKKLKSKTLLIKGKPISADLRSNEARRISNALRDQGYFDFSPAQFSRFRSSDSSNHKVNFNFIILPPDDDSLFRKYTVGDIYIYPGFAAEQPTTSYRDTVIDGYHFMTIDGNTIVKPKFIIQKMGLKSGDYYSYRDFRKTILQLNTLDIFKTPRINIQKRTDGSNILDYHIQLSKEKKFEDEVGIDNFLSSIAANQLLFGISLHAGRRIKNLFGGSETFALNLDGSTESSFSGQSSGNITTLGIGMDIYTPRYRDWLSLGGVRLLPLGKRLFSDDFMSDLSTLGEQYFTVNFKYEDFQDYYSSTSIKLSRGVNLTRGNHKFNFVFQDIDLLSPSKGTLFDTLVRDNIGFRESFQEQLITGFIFRSFNYSYKSPIRKRKSYDLFFGIESSGHEIALFNRIAKNDNPFFRFNGEKFFFSQFVKAEIEPKFTYYFNRKSSLATRLGIGVVHPYGKTVKAPFSELFSLGGSYSLRGWRSRSVGPGAVNSTNLARPFAADHFKLELSTEYRFDLGWILEGALFAEAGNVWSLKGDSTNQDSKLNFNKFNNYGVDAGGGLRFDLTFFLFRFDVAFPIRNWYEDTNGGYWNLKSLKDATSHPNFSVGINYPF